MPRKPPLPTEFLRRTRELRNEPTEAEKKLWARLRRRQLGFRFRRQHPVGPFVPDFYCHEARLAVELDGGQHLEPAQRIRDRQRDRALKGHGILVLRFWNGDVMHNLEGVLERIRAALEDSVE